MARWICGQGACISPTIMARLSISQVTGSVAPLGGPRQCLALAKICRWIFGSSISRSTPISSSKVPHSSQNSDRPCSAIRCRWSGWLS